MSTRYFAATASDGTPVVRSSATRTYTAASIAKRSNETHWRSSWAGTRALAEKAGRYYSPSDRTEVVDAREVTRAEYLRLKAEWEATARK